MNLVQSNRVCCFTGLTLFVAIAFPFFGGLLGFFGGFALAPTTYYVSESRMAQHSENLTN